MDPFIQVPFKGFGSSRAAPIRVADGIVPGKQLWTVAAEEEGGRGEAFRGGVFPMRTRLEEVAGPTSVMK